MMLSDDKVSHMTHVLLKGLMDKGLVTLKDEAGAVRKDMKRTIAAELKIGADMDEIVRRKLMSFSKKLVESSPEWDVLYRKFFSEEEVKRGRK